MKFLESVRAILKGGTASFNEFELMVLNALSKELPAESRERLQTCLRAINFVARLDGGREVNTYVLRKWRPVLPDATRIDNSKGEKVWAKFQIEGPPGTSNSGKVWLVDGSFFSIEFVNPTEHAEVSLVKAIRIKLA
jgi:hypothetical protein